MASDGVNLSGFDLQAAIDHSKRWRHVAFTETPCEPKLHLILSTRSLTSQHVFVDTLFSLIWIP